MSETPEDAVTPPVEPAGGEEDAPRDEAAATRAGSTKGGSADALTPSPGDEAAVDAAADVTLEAADETDADTDAEVAEVVFEPAATPRRRRRSRSAPAAETTPAPPAPAPAPRRRRTQREPGAQAPVVRAQAKYVRSSARKARLVCDHIRGKSVLEARAILAHTPRAVARDWSKLLESAVANAENNHELVGEDLYIKAVHADEGPTIKRFRPRAMGRATKIRKRTAHLTILLTPKN
jgi:ribosomal protein L22